MIVLIYRGFEYMQIHTLSQPPNSSAPDPGYITKDSPCQASDRDSRGRGSTRACQLPSIRGTRVQASTPIVALSCQASLQLPSPCSPCYSPGLVVLDRSGYVLEQQSSPLHRYFFFFFAPGNGLHSPRCIVFCVCPGSDPLCPSRCVGQCFPSASPPSPVRFPLGSKHPGTTRSIKHPELLPAPVGARRRSLHTAHAVSEGIHIRTIN
ncbi:UNVERIFIED_CONTAM: hypothetical protein FKN15_053568 [Acipenser sinensis]